jgi:hypothetical protein
VRSLVATPDSGVGLLTELEKSSRWLSRAE